MERKVELERLIVDVVRTLRDANMHETLHVFDVRVLSLDPAHLFELSEDGSEPHFKPMLELLLRELTALASMTALTPTARHIRAVEVMHLAGF